MAVDVIIKSKGLFKKNIQFNNILIDGMSYGIMDDAWRLDEGKVGEYTILFNPKHVCRGFEVNIVKNTLNLRLPLPTSDEDINYFYAYIKTICEKFKTEEFIRNEEIVTLNKIDSFIKEDSSFCEDVLETMKKDFESGKYVTQYLMGVMHPISFGSKEMGAIHSIKDLGVFMHQLQSRDLYYAKPNVYQKDIKSYFGIYVLTEAIPSIVPYEAKLFMADKSLKIDYWYISFVCEGNMLGAIPYQDFLNYVDKSDIYDAEHFVITLHKEDMENLVDLYKVEL